MNKPKEDLDLEALLAAASEKVDEDKEQTLKELDEVQRFTMALNLKRGETKVAAILIYDYYNLWRGKSAKKLRNAGFFKQFSKYYEKIRTKTGTYYLLDPAPFDLSDEKFWEVRKRLRTSKALKKRISHGKKTTSKKQGQESRSEKTLS